MYRGFNLKIKLNDSLVESYKDQGLSIQEKYKSNILDKFKDVVRESHQLDAAKIESLFFPQIEADIFISNSHKNVDEVMALAGFLNWKFSLKVFVDSCVWESVRNLQKILDDKYSWTNYEKRSYSYVAVGKSASHAHMMLSVALSRMINTTECIFFYNTPESITPFNNTDSTTSPWIYSEIALTQIIQKRIPQRRKGQETKLFTERGYINESLELHYQADLGHLSPLNAQDFNAWIDKVVNTPQKALDALYDMIPLPTKPHLI
ncbi:hypothetical protein SAMN05661012_00006 [Chitinophaga sancti]|nr:hypothetical protein SAMN05661012_00006 [Chitinophaga sancti]